MTFHASGSSAFDMELCKGSFQLLALASLIATFASDKHQSIPVGFDV